MLVGVSALSVARKSASRADCQAFLGRSYFQTAKAGGEVSGQFTQPSCRVLISQISSCSRDVERGGLPSPAAAIAARQAVTTVRIVKLVLNRHIVALSGPVQGGRGAATF